MTVFQQRQKKKHRRGTMKMRKTDAAAGRIGIVAGTIRLIGVTVALSSGSSFVRRQSPILPISHRRTDALFQIQSPQRLHRTSNNGPLMYFDDVSRYGYDITDGEWHPETASAAVFVEGGGVMGSLSPQEMEERLAREKKKAMKRLLHGYDATSASELRTDEVEMVLKQWSKKCGLTGNEFGDEIYSNIRDVHVCQSTTVAGCLADFWEKTVDVIHQETKGGGGTKKKRDEDDDGSSIIMMVFPNCPTLYEYKTMSTMHASIDFCSDVCLHFGKKFTLTHFHPKYKNSPKMIHPTRHSPFPVLGLHFDGEHDEYVSRLSDKYGIDPKKKLLQVNEIGPSKQDWIKERAATFEVLYNKAAASSSKDMLTRGTASRNISQRFPKEEVVDMTKNWMNRWTNGVGGRRGGATPKSSSTSSSSSSSSSDGGGGGTTGINKALRYSETVRNWNVVYDKVPEEIYAKIWRTISTLDDMGRSQKGCGGEEMDDADGSQKTPTSGDGGGKFSQMEFFNNLSSAFGSGGTSSSSSTSSGSSSGSPLAGRRVMSTMFITTKFRAFNSEGFKRFAITVNAALKRLTDEKMFLEVFHPEYVGKKGYKNEFRRSPFPTLQICYEKKEGHGDAKKK